MDFWSWLLCWWSRMKLIPILHFNKGISGAVQTVFQNLLFSVQTFFGAVLCPISLFFTNSSKCSASAEVMLHTIFSSIPLSSLPSPPPPPSPAHFPDLAFCSMRTKQEETTIHCYNPGLVPISAQTIH